RCPGFGRRESSRTLGRRTRRPAWRRGAPWREPRRGAARNRGRAEGRPKRWDGWPRRSLLPPRALVRFPRPRPFGKRFATRDQTERGESGAAFRRGPYVKSDIPLGSPTFVLSARAAQSQTTPPISIATGTIRNAAASEVASEITPIRKGAG